MGLHAESSTLLWQQAGGDDLLEDLLGWTDGDDDDKGEGTSGTNYQALQRKQDDIRHDAEEAAMSDIDVNTVAAPDDGEQDDDSDSEYAFNPDAQLEEAQAENHAAYEGQQFYGKIGFGEFAQYMRNKRRKLAVQQGAARQNADDSEKSELLKGLRIHINGETDPPAHVLSRLVVLHGGVYVPYLDAKKTSATHIIASNLTPSKRVQFKQYKVVRAEWLLDSLRDKKVKDWRLYREDQKPLRAADVGYAPAGTAIAQPRLSFATSKSKPPTSKLAKSSLADIPSAAKIPSPKRLPPPTSDPISVLHVQGAEDAASAGQADEGNTGWYPSKPNARSVQLLKDERWRLNETAVNTTEFLEKYYRESRLHWLSTWKAELKKMVGELSEEKGKTVDLGDGGRKKKTALKGTAEDGRVIMHIDFDSFFVSASLLARPHLKGQPVVVCHASVGDNNSSSEIASASYEARAFGIKNGMSLGSARSRCPQVQTVPYDFDLYRSTSAKFYSILFSHAQELEAVSIDEAYISLAPTEQALTGSELLQKAESIRAEIREATGLETSIGVSHNKLLARLATNRAKPCSSFQIGNGVDPSGKDVQDFLRDIDVESLPQIGWKRANEVEEKLTELWKRLKSGHFARKDEGKGRETLLAEEDKFESVGSLLRFSKNQLKEALGEKTGEMLYNYARGIDARELETENVRKSVSAEVNYGIRFKADDEVEKFMLGLGGEVAARLQRLKYKGRQLTLKVMKRAETAPIEPPKFLGHGICDVFNASRTVELTNDNGLIGATAWELMRSLKIPPEELRGIGLQMQKLESADSATSTSVREGQGLLNFKPKAIQKQRVTATSNPLREVDELPKAAQREPILISTSSPKVTIGYEGMTAPELLQSRSLRARHNVSYVDLSSGEEQDEDIRVLSQMPKGFQEKPFKQTLLAGQVTKRSKSLSEPPKPKPIAPEPIVIEATSSVHALTDEVFNPDNVTDEDLEHLGIDVAYFRCHSRRVRAELLKDFMSKVKGTRVEAVLKKKKDNGKPAVPLYAPVFEEAAANKAKREARLAWEKEQEALAERDEEFYMPNFGTDKALKIPSFAGKSDLQGLRSVLREWMDGVGIDFGPAEEEVDDLKAFCMQTISRNPIKNGGVGQDIAKVADLLLWWKYLIDQREGRSFSTGSQLVAAQAWREAWGTIRAELNKVVEKDWGAPLRI